METEKATRVQDLPHEFVGIANAPASSLSGMQSRVGQCSVCGRGQAAELHHRTVREQASAFDLVVTEKGS